MGKGIGILIGTVIGYFIFIIPGVIVWIYGLYDAYTTAQKMNKGVVAYKETSMGKVIGFIVVEIILAIIFFLFIAAMVIGSSPSYYY